MLYVGMSDDDVNYLEETLKELDGELRQDYRINPSENCIRRFKEVSIKLSSILPDVSDRTTFEIDDLLYHDDKTINNISKTTLYSEETISRIYEGCFKSYEHVYCRTVMCRSQRSKTALYDTTYLQLLQLVPQHFFDRGFLREYTIRYLLASRCEFKWCLAVKLLTVVAKHVKESFAKNLFYGMYSIFMLRNLTKIPQPKDPNKRRVATWLSEQSKVIFERIDLKSLEVKDKFLREYLQYTCSDEAHNSRHYFSILRVTFSGGYSIMLVRDLHTYFMSARNEEEKLEHLTTFLQSLFINHKTSSTSDYTLKCYSLVYTLGGILEGIKRYEDYTDDELRNLEKHHNFEIEPYLSDDTFNSLVWRPNVRQLINEKLSDAKPSKNEKETLEEHDYTIEKFILFDDLMKSMHVLNIAYTALFKCEDLLKTTGYVGDAAIFRRNFLNDYLNDIIINPSKRGYIPWGIELILKKCPFMVLSNRYDYLMEDLIKLLKGEHIDEITEEKIFLALNSVDKVDEYRLYVLHER